jgi:hypothetical protein
MKLIETKTLGSTTATVTFASIPTSFTDLVVLISGRCTRAEVSNNLFMYVNGDTDAGDYSTRILDGSGSGVSSSTGQSAGVLASANATANTFANIQITIPNYQSSTAKSFSVDAVSENNATAAIQRLVAGLYTPTDTITSLVFDPANATDFVAGSTFSLYGVLKGSDGIVTTS